MLALAVFATLLFLVSGGLLIASEPKEAPTVPYDSEFNKAAARYSVPKRLAVAIVSHESSFNPRAVNYEKSADLRRGHDVDSLGLCQILFPDTAQSLRPGVTRDECFDVETNLDMGCKYMAQCLRRWPAAPGDFPADAVSAYNAGHSTRRQDGTFTNQGYVDAVRFEWEHFANV